VLYINSTEKQPPGPSYWKFNSSLLDDPKYIDLIKDNVPLWLTGFKEVLDKSLLWDLIKYKIRQLTINIVKQRHEKGEATFVKLKRN